MTVAGGVQTTRDPCSDKRSVVVWKDTLDGDEWTKKVGPHEVTCKGCNKKIKLDKKKKYTMQHKKNCAILTGKECIHIVNQMNSIMGVHLSLW